MWDRPGLAGSARGRPAPWRPPSPCFEQPEEHRRRRRRPVAAQPDDADLAQQRRIGDPSTLRPGEPALRQRELRHHRDAEAERRQRHRGARHLHLAADVEGRADARRRLLHHRPHAVGAAGYHDRQLAQRGERDAPSGAARREARRRQRQDLFLQERRESRGSAPRPGAGRCRNPAPAGGYLPAPPPAATPGRAARRRDARGGRRRSTAAAHQSRRAAGSRGRAAHPSWPRPPARS